MAFTVNVFLVFEIGPHHVAHVCLGLWAFLPRPLEHIDYWSVSCVLNFYKIIQICEFSKFAGRIEFNILSLTIYLTVTCCPLYCLFNLYELFFSLM